MFDVGINVVDDEWSVFRGWVFAVHPHPAYDVQTLTHNAGFTEPNVLFSRVRTEEFPHEGSCLLMQGV